MPYLFLIRHGASFMPHPALVGEILAWNEAMAKKGILLDGNPLRPAGEAVTLRVRRGRSMTAPGHFSAEEEQVSAYVLVDRPDLKGAIALAATHPMAKAATIEVREVWGALPALMGSPRPKRRPRRSPPRSPGPRSRRSAPGHP
ncbi:MAG: transcription initiation protein [Spirochaetes bacterium]|nr:transcription initiation protein [Spirochaetota bacterium]